MLHEFTHTASTTPISPARAPHQPPADAIAPDDRERVFLVGAAIKGEQRRLSYDVAESLEELERLAETAGLKVHGG